MSREKITCLIVVYNEAGRIRPVLEHAVKWADEILLVDKGSTDGTKEIAESYGVRVETIPFSNQGHEDMVSIFQLPSHDWVWVFTASEMPTKGVIEAGREAISDNVDIVLIPTKMFTFGKFTPTSPSGIRFLSRLIHRKRAVITNDVHSNFSVIGEGVKAIPFTENCHVIHQTHATAESFMKAQSSYMIAETFKGNPHLSMIMALATADQLDGEAYSAPELLEEKLAWKIYWLGTALHLLEQLRNEDVPKQYLQRAETMVAEHWQVDSIPSLNGRRETTEGGQSI